MGIPLNLNPRPMHLEPKFVIAVSLMQAGGAAVAQVEGLNHLLIGGLSAGSIITAIGAVFVMKEKVRRNEEDLTGHKRETRTALDGIVSEFRSSFSQMREDHREDQRETREQLTTLTNNIGDIKALVEKRIAEQHRQERNR